MKFKMIVSVIGIFLGIFTSNICKTTASLLPPIIIIASGNDSNTLAHKSVLKPFKFIEAPLIFEPCNFTQAIGNFTVSAIPLEVASSLSISGSGSRSLLATNTVQDSKRKDQVFCRYEYFDIFEPKRRVSTDNEFFPINGSQVIYRVTAKFRDSVAQQFGKGKISNDPFTLDEIDLNAGGDSIGKYLKPANESKATNQENAYSDFSKIVSKVLNIQRKMSLKKSPYSYESTNDYELTQRGIQQVIACYDEIIASPKQDNDAVRDEEEDTSHLERREQTKRRQDADRRRHEDNRREEEYLRREREDARYRQEDRRRQEEDERRDFEDRLRATEDKRRAEEENKSRYEDLGQRKYKNTLNIEHRQNENKYRPQQHDIDSKRIQEDTNVKATLKEKGVQEDTKLQEEIKRRSETEKPRTEQVHQKEILEGQGSGKV